MAAAPACWASLPRASVRAARGVRHRSAGTDRHAGQRRRRTPCSPSSVVHEIAGTLPATVDVVLANILAGTLVELAPPLCALRAPGWPAGSGRHPEAAGARSAGGLRTAVADLPSLPSATAGALCRARVGASHEHVHRLPQLQTAAGRDRGGPARRPGLCALRSLRSRVQRAALAGRGSGARAAGGPATGTTSVPALEQTDDAILSEHLRRRSQSMSPGSPR